MVNDQTEDGVIRFGTALNFGEQKVPALSAAIKTLVSIVTGVTNNI